MRCVCVCVLTGSAEHTVLETGEPPNQGDASWRKRHLKSVNLNRRWSVGSRTLLARFPGGMPDGRRARYSKQTRADRETQREEGTVDLGDFRDSDFALSAGIAQALRKHVGI